MTLVAYYDKALIADRMSIDSGTSDLNTRSLKQKLHVSKCNHFAWACAGNIPLKRDLPRIESIFKAVVERAHYEGRAQSVSGDEVLYTVGNTGLRSYLLMTRERVSFIDTEGFLEYDSDDICALGTGNTITKVAWVARLPVEKVVPFAASICLTVSAEFDICYQSSLLPFPEKKEQTK